MALNLDLYSGMYRVWHMPLVSIAPMTIAPKEPTTAPDHHNCSGQWNLPWDKCSGDIYWGNIFSGNNCSIDSCFNSDHYSGNNCSVHGNNVPCTRANRNKHHTTVYYWQAGTQHKQHGTVLTQVLHLRKRRKTGRKYRYCCHRHLQVEPRESGFRSTSAKTSTDHTELGASAAVPPRPIIVKLTSYRKRKEILQKETSKGDRRRHSGRLDCQKPETVEKNMWSQES